MRNTRGNGTGNAWRNSLYRTRKRMAKYRGVDAWLNVGIMHGERRGNGTENVLKISLNRKETHRRTQGGGVERMAKRSGECMGNGSHEGKENLTELKVELRGMHGKRARERNRECTFSRTHSERIAERSKNAQGMH